MLLPDDRENVKLRAQRRNKLVYTFFLQLVIDIALPFYIEYYIVAIHYLRKLSW